MSVGRRPGPSTRTRVVELSGDDRLAHEDRLATEEPLEIRFGWPGGAETVVVTMRTPGHDFELAAGWAVHEQLIRPSDITSVRYCTDQDLTPEQEFNVVTLDLGRRPDRLPAARLMNSACGVCGSGSVDEVVRDLRPVPPVPTLAADLLRSLPGRLLEAQPGFARTGGLHAAGLFGADGTAVVVREDVGRHNAVDKAVGSVVLGSGTLPPILVLSGRIGFELVQKAAVSGIPVVVAVGAPTSLAVDLAREAGIALVGFTREDRCVVYAGEAALGV